MREIIMVDFRINGTLQTGAVRNRPYRGAKLSIYFYHSPQVGSLVHWFIQGFGYAQGLRHTAYAYYYINLSCDLRYNPTRLLVRWFISQVRKP